MSKDVEFAQVRGKVITFNISPKGHYEGAMIDTGGGIVQVNFPRHATEELAASMQVGSDVDLRGELSNEDFAHAVYRIADEGRQIEVDGVVSHLNYTLQGEVNGFRFEDGTFVHLKPESAKRHRPRVGEKVTAVGSRRVGSDAIVIEARSIRRREVDEGARA